MALLPAPTNPFGSELTRLDCVLKLTSFPCSSLLVVYRVIKLLKGIAREESCHEIACTSPSNVHLYELIAVTLFLSLPAVAVLLTTLQRYLGNQEDGL